MCNYIFCIDFLGYCLLVTFCEVFFVSKAHRKNENLGAIMRMHDFCASRSVLLVTE